MRPRGMPARMLRVSNTYACEQTPVSRAQEQADALEYERAATGERGDDGEA